VENAPTQEMWRWVPLLNAHVIGSDRTTLIERLLESA
jgi:hypothetical protein